ncbi:hypothetical protein TRFO_42831 [Tritrichomonas foetus]|uniref:Uncharacterized protein n=1 Tax=Tritrichomonas foetus TaxID=1144522 RepID=A0A1J4KUH7_9EUKA|nr:hypothetical protein TRFO_42831 [Tritrichomonas foetus]|eukprot:OHT14923.1 hypothetical protein TRFO_42831 [Tritrichomonas foetus]
MAFNQTYIQTPQPINYPGGNYQTQAMYQNYQQPYNYQHPMPQQIGSPVRQHSAYFTRFPIPSEDESKYGNLFALLTTIDEIESEFCDGNLDEKLHQELLQSYKNQFLKLNGVLKLSRNDIEQFCNCAQLNCSYALSTLFSSVVSPLSQSDDKERLRVAMEIGEQFTTLLDFCTMGSIGAGMIYETVSKIRSLLMLINIYTIDEVKQYTDKWADTLSRMKPDAIVPQSILDDIKTDYPAWKDAVNNACRQ